MDKKFRDFLINFNKFKNKHLWSGCFHEDSNCSQRIIKAHSIQNNKILNKISENGEVLMFGAVGGNDYGITTDLQEKGRKKATTFTGFCGHHDHSIFRPIENYDYIPGNAEQEFLFTYRATAKEYHAKKSSANMYRTLLDLLDKGSYTAISSSFEAGPPSEEHIHYMKELYSRALFGTQDAEKRLERYRQKLNTDLENMFYDDIITNVIVLGEEYHIAVSSATFLEENLNGTKINDLGDFSISLAPLFITVFPQNGQTFILLSHFKRNDRRYRFIKEDLLKRDTREIKMILSNIILSHVENLVVSPKRWRETKLSTRNKITKLFNKNTKEVNNPLIIDYNLDLFL
ncbi:hypothetical protein [Neobacillus massiliamazoniensis]|uniref:Uncharacterized protein n=1 Tax=Neobacillus massiliamazoniensis TaxID=1499688 RepID=A0A0U1NYV9_9BACI|nr:hypothetical protein [Neobacillus massiliamazoniensis]CRK83002.1 hypothetical protein BN000_02957 [Neobacillus massiliamazoniensis]